jgi:hypothetical protein
MRKVQSLMSENSDAHARGDANSARRGVEFADVIDMIGIDSTSGAVVLSMEETRPWDGSELRLFQLQEKCNAYLSFALDGEMREAYPGLADRPLCVRLNTLFTPDPAALRLIALVSRQISFQGISFEVLVAGNRVNLADPAAGFSI